MLRCVVQRHLAGRGALVWRGRPRPLGARAMAAKADTASTLRKLHELKIDQSFVRELPGDPSTENSLRQARRPLLSLPRGAAALARHILCALACDASRHLRCFLASAVWPVSRHLAAPLSPSRVRR